MKIAHTVDKNHQSPIEKKALVFWGYQIFCQWAVWDSIGIYDPGKWAPASTKPVSRKAQVSCPPWPERLLLWRFKYEQVVAGAY